MRHELESGAWVDMRPVQDLRQRDREVYNAPLDMEVGVVESAGKIAMDLSERRYSTRTPREQRKALLARVLTAWSYEDLPVPSWAGGIENEASFGEIPLGDWDQIDALLDPYVDKIRKRADPKDGPSPTSTASNGSSTTKAARSRQA